MALRIGNGFDVHQLAPGLPLFLGGVKLEHTMGCVAHSDGDVLIHALCDAILGALALGDIGKHFPDTDNAFKGIDSKILLSQCMEMVKERGWRVVNADCTIAAQKPKMAPYIPAMRECLASLLEVETDCVSVKATTTEHLGFCGREEGIAVMASVLLEK
ncbi:MAG: 2-C-methyl-D-erythritol 2,4-cyclodiphosphate synthase [Bacteroidales bacterium]|nr:2-C-methyl-D-erythritol 2,4-cyclodiphosphate synthase [Candidatus Egerieousia equi]